MTMISAISGIEPKQPATTTPRTVEMLSGELAADAAVGEQARGGHEGIGDGEPGVVEF